jgi:RNA polymerase sigma-70 factor (ECF subfamily)
MSAPEVTRASTPPSEVATDPSDAPLAPSDVAALASAARSGDRGAERTLVARLVPAIRAFASRRLSTRAAIEDFAQDVVLLFVEALRGGRIEEPARAGSFALGICRNLARERARVRDRRREALERGLELPEPTLPSEPHLFHRAQLEDCLSLLTSKAREVISASYASELADAEIASSLSLTEANVRVIRHRSLTALRTCVEGGVSWQR